VYVPVQAGSNGQEADCGDHQPDVSPCGGEVSTQQQRVAEQYENSSGASAAGGEPGEVRRRGLRQERDCFSARPGIALASAATRILLADSAASTSSTKPFVRIPFASTFPAGDEIETRHLLKDETLNGTLLIGDKDFNSPLKPFPVSATAYTLNPEVRHFWRYVIVFIVLAMGGVLSLILNQTLPNRIQKLDLEERLQALAKTTADLSTHLDSRLGVLVRIQWTRLKDLIRSRSTVFPEFASVAKLADDGLTKLTSRVKLLQQMDLMRSR
jgi:hypothetical protein